MGIRTKVRWPFKLAVALATLLVGGVYFVGTQPESPFAPALHEPGPAADVEGLRRDVKWLSVERFPRDYTAREFQARIVQELMARFSALGLETKEERFQISQGNFSNVSALKRAPYPSGRIVVGAHYDSYRRLPGADDNASGVAGLLELARLVSKHAPGTDIEFVAYANEEPPFFGSSDMGSYVHAQALRRDRVSVKAMFSLEMIGYFSDEPESQEFPFPALKLFYPTRGNFMAVIGNLENVSLVRRVKRGMRSHGDLPIYSFNAPAWVQGIDWSDQRNYWDLGMPAVMITDTSYLRNHRYHEEGDTWDRLDYVRMGQAVSALYETLFDL